MQLNTSYTTQDHIAHMYHLETIWNNLILQGEIFLFMVAIKFLQLLMIETAFFVLIVNLESEKLQFPDSVQKVDQITAD